MDSICEGDERSSSEISFPSLDLMHSREQEDIEYGTTTSTNEIDGIKSNISILDACGMDNPAVVDNPYDSCDDEDYDGYPTDEQTMGSFPRPREAERVRLNILELARRRLATKKTTEILGDEQNIDDSYFVANVDTENVEDENAVTFDGEPDVDDCSFLANVDVEDVEIKQHPKDSDREEYVFGFSFLATVNGEVVEEQPDDSSFIVGAGVEDVPGDFQSIGDSMGGTAANSYYDVHASTLSRASASTRISIGDMILKESNIAAQMVRSDSNVKRNLDANTAGEDQSASTYSYGRAYYAENATLGSKYTSTLSALTNDDLLHARRTGMSAAINATEIGGGLSFDGGEANQDSQPRRGGEIKISSAVPVDANSGALIFQPDISLEETSGQLSTIHISDQATGGRGYVDEEAAHNAKGCCARLTCSRPAKLCTMSSILLLVVGGVALALLLPEKKITSNSSINDVCASGAPCSKEGLRCNDGTTESCCGESFYSFVCDCANVDGKLWYTCIHTDVCFDPLCESYSPTTSAPTLRPSKAPKSKQIYSTFSITSTPTVGVTTHTLSEAQESSVPESTIYTELPITDTPSVLVTSHPTTTFPPSENTDSLMYTILPTTDIPTDQASAVFPTQQPTRKPTPSPSAVNISSKDPTVLLTSSSSVSNAPIATLESSLWIVTVQAAQDAFINATSPDENYGSTQLLSVDFSPILWSIISFDGSSVVRNITRNHQREQTIQVLNAKLRLYSLDQGGDAMVFSLPHARQWAETSLTWNNKDQVDRFGEFQVGSLGWAEPFSWNEIDVTAAFASGIGTDFLLSFAIVSDSINGVTFASRERDSGSFSPELVLTFIDDKGIATNSSLSNPPSSIFAPESPPTSSMAPAMISVDTFPANTIVPSSVSPSFTQADLSDNTAVPPGCATADDINLASEQSLLSNQRNVKLFVVFPTKDTYVDGGIYSDENHGSYDALTLDSSTGKVLIEFDLDLLAVTSSAVPIISATLRLFVVRVEGTISLSIFKQSGEWEEGQVTWENFATSLSPLFAADATGVGNSFTVTSSDGGQWLDVDVKDFIDGIQINNFVLSIENDSASGKCVFASRETCHSSKLVVITESIF